MVAPNISVVSLLGNERGNACGESGACRVWRGRREGCRMIVTSIEKTRKTQLKEESATRAREERRKGEREQMLKSCGKIAARD